MINLFGWLSSKKKTGVAEAKPSGLYTPPTHYTHVKPTEVKDLLMSELLNRVLQSGKPMGGTIEYDDDNNVVTYTVDKVVDDDS